MSYLLPYAKAWVSGVGTAVTAYLGTWTDDVRILGITALITAVATYAVPNGEKPEGGAVDDGSWT